MYSEQNIKIFDLKYDENFINQFQDGARNILTRGFLTNDLYVKEFEDKFSLFNNSKYTTAVSSGTAALELALRVCDVKGKIVILPSNTFIATALAVENAGGIVKLLDIETDYFGLCPNSLRNILSQKENQVAVCIAVHIGGHISSHFREIIDICHEYKIDLIEDCAHVVGASLDGVGAGNFGRFGCFSFFTTKNMAMGEGGAVTCHSQEDYKSLQSFRQFGRDENNPISHVSKGSNYKLNEFGALLGSLELDRVSSRIDRRRQIAKIYNHLLDKEKYRVITDSINMRGSYYKQIVLPLKIEREKIRIGCELNGISLTGGVYYIPVHRQPNFVGIVTDEDMINCNNFSQKHICPPCYPELTDEQIYFVCKILNGINE